MDWSTVVFLGMCMVSLVLLMGVIMFGTRRSSGMKELEKHLGKRALDFNSDIGELRKILKESEEEKKKILERLQNLETIVTSETWDSIDARNIQFHLKDEETEELNDADKVAKNAKRVR